MKALDRDISGSWGKLKKNRNAFSTAITTGRRSGAGRIIMENYDKLVLIYGGAPSVEPLAFGSDTASGTHIDDDNNDGEGRCKKGDEDNASTHHAASNNNSPSNNSSNNNSTNGNSSSLKRKNTDNPEPT